MKKLLIGLTLLSSVSVYSTPFGGKIQADNLYGDSQDKLNLSAECIEFKSRNECRIARILYDFEGRLLEMMDLDLDKLEQSHALYVEQNKHSIKDGDYSHYFSNLKSYDPASMGIATAIDLVRMPFVAIKELARKQEVNRQRVAYAQNSYELLQFLLNKDNSEEVITLNTNNYFVHIELRNYIKELSQIDSLNSN